MQIHIYVNGENHKLREQRKKPSHLSQLEC